MLNKKRLPYIDIARAFAMFSIVLLHALATSTHNYEIYRFLFCFNVPLFFVLSGLTFRVKENETFLQFLKNKLLRIMLPYLVWGLLFLIPYFIFLGDASAESVGQSIGNVFYGNGVAGALKQNTPLWFLPALFTTEILYYFIVKLIKKPQLQLLTLAVIIGAGFGFSILLKNIYLPWGINTALQIGAFFYVGYLIKNHIDKLKKPFIMLALLAVGIVALIFNANDNIIWSDYIYQNYFLTLVSGLAFSGFFIGVARLINHARPLEFVGKNTMAILIFHKLMIVIAQTKLGTVSKLYADSNLALELTIALGVTIITMAISILLGVIIRKILPQLIGEKKVPGRASRGL